jgi:flagellar biosynthesis protein FliP
MPDALPLISVSLFLALVPFALILLTAFTRISIILTFLKQALALQVPSSSVLLALSLILTSYVMLPVMRTIEKEAYLPLKEQELPVEQKLQLFVEKAWPNLRSFMLKQTREQDLQLFIDIGELQEVERIEDLPWQCVIPAFILSELRAAFMLGFLLYLPFLVLDMLISSILSALGMVMLPPILISLPFKILLFILVDGWHLIVQQIVSSYS